jgi:Flp pilus assembly protein TadG
MSRRLLPVFLADRRGVAAAEFAIILPVLILILLGTAEIGSALLIDRKVTRATHIIADLVAQSETVTTAQLEDIMQAAEEIMRPYPAESATIVLSSVARQPGDTDPTVAWSVTRRGTALVTGTSYELPEIELGEGESVIVGRVTFAFVPLFQSLVLEAFTISDRAFLRPRRTSAVSRI